MRTDPNVLDIFFRRIGSDLGVFANAADVPTLPPKCCPSGVFLVEYLGAALECSETRAVSSDSLSNKSMPMRLGMDQDAMVQRLNHMQEMQVIHVVPPVHFFALVQT